MLLAFIVLASLGARVLLARSRAKLTLHEQFRPDLQPVPGVPALVPRRVRIQTGAAPHPAVCMVKRRVAARLAQEVVFDIRDVSVSYGEQEGA